jgi:predicted phosphodiesterase
MKQNKTEVVRLTKAELEVLEGVRAINKKASSPKVVKKFLSHNEGKLWFVLPDAHYPYQNEKLMQKVFKCISDNDVTGVCISGDWLDLFTLGSYNADSLGLLRNITLTEEYAAGLKGIQDLEQALPAEATRAFIFGNHEDRYFREMYKRDISKYGEELQNPADALHLKQYGYEVLTNWKDDFYTIGDLDVMHGIYCNIHTAKKHLEMHGRSVMFGHTHRVQTHFTAHEAAFNIGCLADIPNAAFNYMPRMQKENWSNSFSAVRVIGGKSYVEMITVRNDKFIFNGKIY